MSNIKTGTTFENQMAEYLATAGFWVHRIVPSAAGQPADLIVVYGRYHSLIDCKVLSTNAGFPFERVEPNQRTAMGLFRECGLFDCWFALKLPDGGIRMLSYYTIRSYENSGRKSISQKELLSFTDVITLADWITYAKQEAVL